jgi:hypothetical protein
MGHTRLGALLVYGGLKGPNDPPTEIGLKVKEDG